jgi:hypothetical protein
MMQQTQIAAVGRKTTNSEPTVWPNLYASLAQEQATLLDVIWEQHRYHEHRRWDVQALVGAIDLSALTPADRFFVANAGRAELTTKPGADRVTRLADKECRRWLGTHDSLAKIMQACGTWSRYWNEEEAHHETAFNFIAAALALNPPDDLTVIEYRKIFPDDDMLRTLTLLACSEINAAVTYNEYAHRTAEPGLKALLLQVGADEVQHMRYFISFAKALVDSQMYEPKSVLAIAHLFVRPGGEIYGATRDTKASRDTHVNWWDHLDEAQGGVSLLMGVKKKLAMTYKMVQQITGIVVSSPEDIEDKWMDLIAQEQSA